MIPLINILRKIPLSHALFKRNSWLIFCKWLHKVRMPQCYRPLLWLTPCATIIPQFIATTAVTEYEVEENITQLMMLVRIALEKGDLDRAEAILEIGINISEEYHTYLTMPYMYDVLSSISFVAGDFKKAEFLLVRVIEKMAQLGIPEDDSQIIDFKLRLARIYSYNDKIKLAEIGFKSCLMEQELKILQGDTSTKTGLLYVNVLFWYALHRIKNKDYKRGKELMECAHNYSMKIRGLTPYQEMIILYTMGDLNIQLEEYDMALQNFQSAVLLGKGIGSINLPKYYFKLGKIYLKMGSTKTAEVWLQEAYNLAELLNDKEVLDEAGEILLELD